MILGRMTNQICCFVMKTSSNDSVTARARICTSRSFERAALRPTRPNEPSPSPGRAENVTLGRLNDDVVTLVPPRALAVPGRTDALLAVSGVPGRARLGKSAILATIAPLR